MTRREYRFYTCKNRYWWMRFTYGWFGFQAFCSWWAGL